MLKLFILLTVYKHTDAMTINLFEDDYHRTLTNIFHYFHPFRCEKISATFRQNELKLSFAYLVRFINIINIIISGRLTNIC